LALSGGSSQSGIDVPWARAKIDALMGQMQRGGETDALRRQVIDIALRSHLVSKFTSLVAVDVTPVRPATDELNTRAIPNNLPAGQVHAKIFGTLPQTATPAALYLWTGLIVLLLAATAHRCTRPGRGFHSAFRK
jgi:Ca-activated chloride channel family protein